MVALVVVRQDLGHLRLPLEEQNVDDLREKEKNQRVIIVHGKRKCRRMQTKKGISPDGFNGCETHTLESGDALWRKMSASCDLSLDAVVISSRA